MSALSEILAGVSLSLSGRFRLQGQEALNGIRLWVDQTSPFLPLRLIVLDDESRSEQARENVLRLLTRDRVDLLFGPYSSVLTMAAAPIAEGHGKILWNHGGASDAIY
ncbi:MAG TPA: ABC transporter substrate-binding protein, partial [Thermoanaerobaculia bacterium]|nr:ABC transporter substrate-binding protein [Thermoanaerobaculia bacterium]